MKEIINQYKNSVKAIIKNITGTSNEDLEQEVYLKTWKNIDKYKEQGKFRQWISTITSNLCRDYMRKSSKTAEVITLDDEETNKIVSEKYNTEEIFEKKLRQKRVAEAILSLPKKMQEVIVLYEIEGLDYQEISEQIHCPLGTVKSRIFKARKELYEKLSDYI